MMQPAGGAFMHERVLEIATDRIAPNLRLVYDPQIIDDLCRSIMTYGQRKPISTWFDGRRLRIADGEKRWRACRRLRMVRMNVVIITGEQSTLPSP